MTMTGIRSTGMNFELDTSLAAGYTSKSQKIRIMSEAWVRDNMYCPCCGNYRIRKLPNNSPVADFLCEECGAIFELKSTGVDKRKISDGAYSTMIKRITGFNNPHLFVMRYRADYIISWLSFVPNFFFVPSIIEPRAPLSANARRAGWVGCNILYSEIPAQGKIILIDNFHLTDINSAVNIYNNMKKSELENIEQRGWVLDVMSCVNRLPCEFTLRDVYRFADLLKSKHPANHNINAKIRQQLQVLRDMGVIQFLGNGHYRRL